MRLTAFDHTLDRIRIIWRQAVIDDNTLLGLAQWCDHQASSDSPDPALAEFTVAQLDAAAKWFR